VIVLSTVFHDQFEVNLFGRRRWKVYHSFHVYSTHVGQVHVARTLR
jgi:hypothetical protein